MLLYSTMLDIKDDVTKNDFISVVMEWNKGNTRNDGNTIKNIEWRGELNVRYGDDKLWMQIEEYGNGNIIAVRYEKIQDDGVVWDTDYVMNFNLMKMAIRLDRSFDTNALLHDRVFSTPYFVKFLIDRGYVKNDGELPVKYEPIYVNKTNLKLLANVINGEAEHALPVVYVSKTKDDKDPINVKDLAYKLKGVAHVLVQEKHSSNGWLKKMCDGKDEFYGDIGVYYSTPNAKRSFLHQEKEGFEELFNELFQYIIQNSASKYVSDLFTFQGVKSEMLLDRINEKVDELKKNMEIKATEDYCNQLISELEDVKKQVKNLREENAESKQEISLYKYLLNQKQSKEDERAKQGDAQPLIYTGKEINYYDGELKDIILWSLIKARKNIADNTRKAHVVDDIVDKNDYNHLGEDKAKELKKLLKNYNGMTKPLRSKLQRLGFDITEEGDHYKLTYHKDGRYFGTLSKTPSDDRTGKNITGELADLCF